ncbi:hypothetical protein Ancab_034123 [Ancistrocladus abbreviatus]
MVLGISHSSSIQRPIRADLGLSIRHWQAANSSSWVVKHAAIDFGQIGRHMVTDSQRSVSQDKGVHLYPFTSVTNLAGLVTSQSPIWPDQSLVGELGH